MCCREMSLIERSGCRSIYDESCTFTDEIDTYTLDKWSLSLAPTCLS